MKKFIFVVALVVFGAKYGMDYISSGKFQAYGDRTKAPWTCEVNMIIAQYFEVISKYDREVFYLQKIIERCPDSITAEQASFDIAHAYESMGHRADAIAAYEDYAQKFSGTKRARIATKAAGMLKTTS